MPPTWSGACERHTPAAPERLRASMAWGGSILGLAAMIVDHRWLRQPWVALGLLAFTYPAPRTDPVSKFSYLSQVGVVALVGAVTVGPAWWSLPSASAPSSPMRSACASSQGGVGQRRARDAGVHCGVRGLRRGVRRHRSDGVTLDYMPAGLTLAGMYFFATRALFYFTLLLREARAARAAHDPPLRNTGVHSHLTGSVIAAAAIRSLPPEAWVTVLAVLGVLGLLTTRIWKRPLGRGAEQIHSRSG